METNTLDLSAITVDTLVDENDGDFSSGDLSLREALTLVEEGGTIDFASGLANAAAGFGQGTIGLSLGALTIDKVVTVAGLGSDKLTVDGNGQSAVFSIDSSAFSGGPQATLQGLTISGASGSGISSDASFTVQDSKVTGNGGAGIVSFGYVTLANTQVEANGGNGVQSYAGSSLADSRVAGNQGDGVTSEGEVSVTDSEIVDNASDGVVGSRITLTGSTVSGNIDGGVTVTANNGYGGDIAISESTISNNGTGVDASAGFGGGVSLSDSRVENNRNNGVIGSDVTIENSSITGNFFSGVVSTNKGIISNSTISQNRGAGVENNGEPISRFGFLSEVAASMAISSSTITGNGSDATGTGGVANVTRTDGYLNVLTLNNTIVAKNQGTASDDVSGVIESLGYNLIGNGDGVVDGLATISAGPGDIIGDRTNRIDPLLSALQDNGGGTLSQTLLPGSLAIDAGDPAITSGFDQRGSGFARVVDGNGDGQAIADMGAIEAPVVTTEPPTDTIEGTDENDRLIGDNDDNIIKGLGGDDVLSGRNGNDTLEGGAGNDKMRGGQGDDVLGGGQGRDILRGGEGQDTFVFVQLNDASDVITDFEVGVDRIDLSAIFAAAEYSGDTPIEDYVRIGAAGSRNSVLEILDVTASAAAQQSVYTRVAVLNRVAIADMDESSFIV